MRSRVAQITRQVTSTAYSIQNRPRTALAEFRAGWLCQSCRSKSTVRRPPAVGVLWSIGRSTIDQRWRQSVGSARRFSSTSRFQDEPHLPNTNSQHELPSKQESRRSPITKRLSHMMDNMQTNIFFAGQRLNDLTGYSAIETLKNDIQKQEGLVQKTREDLRQAKENYTQAINQRSQSQREVNELLQRKHAWSPQDLERFTSLYRSDHANEQAESSAQDAVTVAEHAAEEASGRLSASILARYHEEQIWSDKIRRMSTWGTWGLMGVNVLLFLIFQIGVEPWRRRRLVKGFEDKVVEALEKETAAQKGFFVQHAAAIAEQQAVIPEAVPIETAIAEVAVEEIIPETSPTASSQEVTLPDLTEQTGANLDLEDILSRPKQQFQSFRSWLLSLFSEQEIRTRQVDVTAKFIEGALSSAVIISLFAAAVRGR